MSIRRPRVLVLSRNYPNPALPTLGIWTARMVQASRSCADPVVVAPVPWVPPGLPDEPFGRYRAIPRSRSDDGVDVHHPRVPQFPGYALHGTEAPLAYPFIRRLTDRLHAERPFDLIHAHFIYPDGVIAARLGARYGIPVLTTEHASWLPWLVDYPRVRRSVERALLNIRLITTVSDAVRQQAEDIAKGAAPVAVLPNVVDDDVFTLGAETRDPNQLVFVGVVRRVKGLDVLVRALALLAPERPALRLLVVGNPYYRAYRRDEEAVRRLIGELGLENRIRFAGQASPRETAVALRSSALLVLPSRRESFGVVLIEALACGTPVVATRCGGPDEILTSDVGHLAPPDDPPALARAIAEALDAAPSRDPRRLREYAVSRFGRRAVGERIADAYARVLSTSAETAEVIG
jgi:glycosyltransferase involved in cell wall biosynthesis